MTGTVVYRNAFSMGTRLDIVLPGISEEVGNDLFLQIRAELNRLESKISIYKESSIFSDLNRNAFLRPVKTDREILSLISRLIGLSEKTLGYFDFGLGILANTYKENTISSIDQQTVTGILDNLGVRNIFIDQDSMTVSFKTDKLKLDSGGFGKGYGLDSIISLLKS